MSKVLYIMSGPSCAGKSTWIKENFKDVEDVEIISSDEIRKDYTGSYSNFTKENKVWRKVSAKLYNSKASNVILDTTCLTEDKRLFYIGKYKRVYDTFILVSITTTFKIIKERNKHRYTKQVKYADLKALYNRFERPTKKEKRVFDKVIEIRGEC